MTLAQRIAIAKEIAKRRDSAALPQFKFEDFAFPKQVEFFREEGSRFRTAVCSRRAGKTVGIAADMIDTCLSESNITCLYITLTKDNIRKIIWGDIQQIIEKYKVPCKVNNLLMEIRFRNGSKIITGGAKDRMEIEKFRGLKLRKVYIDECQSMRNHISSLIDDIIIPALRDLRGSLYLTGTPGAVKAGAFYDYSHNKNWHNIKWTAFDNPHMHNPPKIDLEVTLTEERMLRGIVETDASYQRETYGIWVEDLESLVIKYNEAINEYDNKVPSDCFYIMGIDIGYNDSDALAILAYSGSTNQVYLVEEVEKAKQDITELAEMIKKYQIKYEPVKMVIDAGALGKKIQEELRLRHALAIEAADKQRKFEYIEFLNADLRKGVFKAHSDSLFAQDSKLVTWDRSNPEKPKISSVYHSDIIDAVLYAYRESRHYIKEVRAPKIDKFSNSFMEKQEKKEAEEMTRKLEDKDLYDYEKELESDGVEDWDAFFDTGF